MHITDFLAHGSLGASDEIGLLMVGVGIAGYLIWAFIVDRRERKNLPEDQASHEDTPTID